MLKLFKRFFLETGATGKTEVAAGIVENQESMENASNLMSWEVLSISSLFGLAVFIGWRFFRASRGQPPEAPSTPRLDGEGPPEHWPWPNTPKGRTLSDLSLEDWRTLSEEQWNNISHLRELQDLQVIVIRHHDSLESARQLVETVS